MPARKCINKMRNFVHLLDALVCGKNREKTDAEQSEDSQIFVEEEIEEAVVRTPSTNVRRIYNATVCGGHDSFFFTRCLSVYSLTHSFVGMFVVSPASYGGAVTSVFSEANVFILKIWQVLSEIMIYDDSIQCTHGGRENDRLLIEHGIHL